MFQNENRANSLDLNGREGIAYFRHEYQRHGQKTAEDHGERDECETGVLLRRRDHDDRSGYQARYDHVINGHAHVPRIVYLSEFHASGLVRDEQSEQQQQPLVAQRQTCENGPDGF